MPPKGNFIPITQTEEKKSNPFYLIVAILVLVIAVGFVYVILNHSNKNADPSEQIVYGPEDNPILRNPELMALVIPDDLPMGSGTILISNLIEKPNGNSGDVVITQKYVSINTVEENFSAFDKYFTENNYKILSSFLDNGIAYFYVVISTRPGDMHVNIFKNDVDDKVVINIESVIKNIKTAD